MKLNKYILFTLYALFALIALNTPLTAILGANTKFTAFDALSPSTLAILGGIPGLITIILVQLLDKIIHGNFHFDIASTVRILTPVVASLYFYKKTKLNSLLPIAAMIAFVIHPIGREVWYFSLFWLIPVICNNIKNPNPLIKSLGSTFAAHALGGAVWIYAFNLPASVWKSLIPIVIFERLILTAGITLTYFALKNIKSEILNYETRNTANKNQKILTSQK